MYINFWHFPNNPLNYSSVADAKKFIVKLHSTCTGPFYRGIDVIGVLLLGFGRVKNIHML